MAADVATEGTPVQASGAEPPARARRRLYWGRFVLVYAVLALATVGAVAGLVLAITGAGVVGSTTWSSWKPSADGTAGAREIAQHVAPLYRLPSGQQLVEVIAKTPSVASGNQTIPLHFLVVQGTKGQQDQVSEVSPDNTVMFSMCGLGPSCSIASGKPSVERGRLVRREVLELSLFAFKYLGGIDNVIAFMPTVPGAQPSVVYLRRADLGATLGQPLNRTLSPKTPLPNTIPAREVRTVDATTESRVFPFSILQTQFGDWALVLKPLSA